MSDVDVYLDNPSKALRNEKSRQRFRQRLTQRFDKNLLEAIERHWELPSLNVTTGPYLDLLIEARDLFVNGYFYSCVAMCGIVGERLLKDVLRTHVLIEKDGQPQHPDEKAFKELENLQASHIKGFLVETELLSSNAAKAANQLADLRNRYVHARGENPEKDASDAIKYLDEIVKDTVSIFKGFDLQNGVMMFKDIDTNGGALRAKKTELKSRKEIS